MNFNVGHLACSFQALPDLALIPPPPPDYKETKKAPGPVTPGKAAKSAPSPAPAEPPLQQKKTAPPPPVPAKSPLQPKEGPLQPATSPATPSSPTQKASTPAAPLTRSQPKSQKPGENKSVVKTALIVRPPKDTKTLADPWAKNYDTLLPLPPSSEVFTKRAKVTVPSEPLISK
ncbi:hypothetical protein ANCCAN_12030 [Ancylostoma caninum]|uniref:Uncharacterized protein n=1 Tax=Ancylostoma caninum TaxID=29170 RepID=A0A368GFL6_ANCCA|nr:hypothetical protein ANCCAN_12030 [Ancylostoma caninum]